MSASLFVNLRRMLTGRHRFSLRQMRDRAAEEGLTDVVAKMERALKVVEETQRVEPGYQKSQSQTSPARGDATLIDNQIDEQIVAIHKSADSNLVGDADDPVVKAAKKVVAEFFPEGVRAITHCSFEEQLSIMDIMMESPKGGFANQVTRLHLDRQLTRLGRLIEEFRAELKQDVSAKQRLRLGAFDSAL